MRRLRDALGAFATGVVVVTTSGVNQGEPIGITANSFNAVSLEPPLVLVSLAKSLRSLDALLSSSSFAVNLLCEHHESVSQQFARSGILKWQDVGVEPGQNGAPLLRERLAHFECTPWATYEGGDHIILVGLVTNYALMRDDQPLIFFRGQYRRLMELSP